MFLLLIQSGRHLSGDERNLARKGFPAVVSCEPILRLVVPRVICCNVRRAEAFRQGAINRFLLLARQRLFSDNFRALVHGSNLHPEVSKCNPRER